MLLYGLAAEGTQNIEESVHLKHLLVNLGFSLDSYCRIPVDII